MKSAKKKTATLGTTKKKSLKKQSVKKQLKDLIQEGPVSDIFRAEQALSMFEAIREVSEKINKSAHKWVFGTIQSMCVDQFVLSICKLYEKPGRYSLRSVPGVLKFLKDNAEKLKIIDSYHLDNQMTRLGTDISELLELKGKDKTVYVSKRLSSKQPKHLNETLETIVNLRNKFIAHPEIIDVRSLQKTKWESAKKLLQYPKDVVGAISDGYLDIVYVDDDGVYGPTGEATKVGRGVKRMLTDLKIIPPRFSE